MSQPLIVIHGGAGSIPDNRVEGKLKGIREACRLAYENYDKTKNILDATQAAIRSMEKDENFNAGYGSVLNLEGEIELEALIVEGKDLKAGAVTGLRNVLHPIDVARLVMEKTPHVLLMAEGAQEFARKHNVPLEPNLHTEAARESLRKFKESNQGPREMEIGTSSGGTVGAIGVDESGHMVSCTSTGGISGKMKGRVGDTPIPGSGGYADDTIGTVSTTGYGDAILRYNVAQRIIAAMENGHSAQKATELVLDGLQKRIGKSAGAITIGKNGDIGIAFTSKRMAWAYHKDGKVYYGIDRGQVCVEDL